MKTIGNLHRFVAISINYTRSLFRKLWLFEYIEGDNEIFARCYVLTFITFLRGDYDLSRKSHFRAICFLPLLPCSQGQNLQMGSLKCHLSTRHFKIESTSRSRFQNGFTKMLILNSELSSNPWYQFLSHLAKVLPCELFKISCISNSW